MKRMLKTILVHLSANADTAERVEAVLNLAKRHTAHVSGVYTTEPYTMPAGALGRSASGAYLTKMRTLAERKAADSERDFLAACKAAGIGADWRHERGTAVEALAARLHYADLGVVGQTAPRSLEEAFVGYPPDHLAMMADGPVIVLPSGSSAKLAGKRILIGWKPCREAGRAVRDALPLLAGAQVSILSVGASATPHDSARDFKRRLDRLAIASDLIESPRPDSDAAEVLKQTPNRLSVDLVVIGAYSRSRWREVLLGGVTQRLLAQAKLPVLLSH
jgi:nucleotide-binding universal stress UspA family protein